MKRSPQHLFEIARVRNLLTQIGQSEKGVDQSLSVSFHWSSSGSSPPVREGNLGRNFYSRCPFLRSGYRHNWQLHRLTVALVNCDSTSPSSVARLTCLVSPS